MSAKIRTIDCLEEFVGVVQRSVDWMDDVGDPALSKEQGLDALVRYVRTWDPGVFDAAFTHPAVQSPRACYKWFLKVHGYGADKWPDHETRDRAAASTIRVFPDAHVGRGDHPF